MSELQPEVVVVGAGPTGVTAAILLAQAGVRCTVLDRWPDVFAQPRAVHLDDEVFRILDRLGVAEEFRAVSRPGAGLRLLAPDHRTLAQFDRVDPCTSNGYPQANMFDQPDLEAILRRRMHALPIDFRGNAEVTSVDTDGVVTYRDLGDGSSQVLRPTYVLGCDGANSVVRRSIGATMVEQGFDEQRWLVVDIATPRELGHWEGVHQVCDSRRAATYMRIGTTRHRWEFELLDAETAADYAALEALAPLLAPWDTDLSDFEVIRTAEYTFRAQVADVWRRGPVFLLGDAAHLTPPFIGQGMGAGIRDAANLAWKIADVLGGSDPGLLATYESERKPHARELVRLAVTVGRSMTGGGRLGDILRRGVVPALVHLPGLRGKVLDSSTPALHLPGRRRNRLVGTLCPNAPVEGRTFDEVVGHDWAVVSRRARRDASDLTEITSPELTAWLGRHEAALVRPDRTVAAAGPLRVVLDGRPARKELTR